MTKKRNWKPYLLLIFAVGYTSIGAAQTVNQPAATSASPQCKQTKLTGEKFIGLIQDIISHGDLTDIPFIESTLQLKFDKSDYSQTPDGKPNLDKVLYTSDTVFDAPIHIDLYVDRDSREQVKSKEFGFMRIEGQRFPSADAEFIRDCLRIHSTDIAEHFGGGFDKIPVTDAAPILEAIKNLGTIGKGGSKFSLGYSYNYKNNGDSINDLVNDVAIHQNP